MAQKPQILVEKHGLNLDEALESENDLNLYASDESENLYDSVESIKEHNISSGYKMTLFYKNPETEELSKSNPANRFFTDSGAKGINVSYSPNYTVFVSFQSRSWCCWKGRGSRTMGATNTHHHTFRTTDYTTRVGARMRAKTTLAAWNSLSKSFIY